MKFRVMGDIFSLIRINFFISTVKGNLRSNQTQFLQPSYNVENQRSIVNKGGHSNAFEASILFRSLELWMNLHLVRHDNCMERVMCEGTANIMKTTYSSSDSASNVNYISRVFAEFSGYEIKD